MTVGGKRGLYKEKMKSLLSLDPETHLLKQKCSDQKPKLVLPLELHSIDLS